MKQKGFTLIELMVVIGIIAILTAIAVPNITKQLRKARVAQAEGQIAQIESALAMYNAELGTYPQDFEDDHKFQYDAGWDSYPPYTQDANGEDKDEWVRCLTQRVQDDITGEIYGPYLPKGVPLDPWKNEYQYYRRLTGNPTAPAIVMDGAEVTCADGSSYTVYDYDDCVPSNLGNGDTDEYVGCGHELNEDAPITETEQLIWTPPPADRTTGADSNTNNLGLLPYYVFSMGRDGKPGGGDDIVPWDAEKRYKRAYQ